MGLWGHGGLNYSNVVLYSEGACMLQEEAVSLPGEQNREKTARIPCPWFILTAFAYGLLSVFERER